MNFSSWDQRILVGSFMVIVFMSLVFPAVGLTNDTANQSNVPELDINSNNVELVGDRPKFPRSPTSGELRYINNESSDNTQIVYQDGEDLIQAETYCFNSDPVNEDCIVQISVFDSGGYNEIDNYTISESDFINQSVITLSADNNESETWEIRYTFEQYENWNSTDLEYSISWELIESPQTDSGLAGIPIIGGIFSTVDAIASVLGWGITVFFWFATWIVELVINAIAILINLVLFGLDLLNFMIGNYTNMVSATTGFASFILLIPVILLTVSLLKLGFIFISILPTT